MSHFEEHVVERWSGAWIAVASLALGLAGIVPLLLYLQFGPGDGNPVGLGLLAVVTVPLAGTGVVVGAVKTIVQRLGNGGE